jgi:tRNA modification GTPase
LHTFGSPPLLEAACRTLCEAGARPAEPGEFTLRAFLAGRIDLTQAEAVLGVIDARGQLELRAALAQLAGGLAAPLASLRESLLELLAHLEAGLDFVEVDIAFITAEELDSQLAAAEEKVRRVAAQMVGRSRSGDEPRVVLGGWPNVGKSSLLNALAGAEAAIVSDLPGTTRDYVGVRTRLDGLECRLIDTAGVDVSLGDETHNDGEAGDKAVAAAVARAAQSRTEQQAGDADLVLFCLDASRPLNDWERGELTASPNTARLCVLTKSDLPRRSDLHTEAISTSSRSGAGLDALRRAIRRELEISLASDAARVAATALRCRESLRLAAEGLARARDLACHELGEELVAAEVRAALNELGQVVGAVYTDDLLDRIFSRFCIGK